MRIKMLQVKWIDSASLHGWEGINEAKALEVGECESVGFLVREDDDAVVLAGSVDHTNENCLGTLIIPRSAIISIQPVSVDNAVQS